MRWNRVLFLSVVLAIIALQVQCTSRNDPADESPTRGTETPASTAETPASSAETPPGTTKTRTHATETAGHGDLVSVDMGPHHFEWKLSTAVDWGYFVDGQPWIVCPSEGVSLVSTTPSRTTANVYYPDSTAAKPIPANNATINVTVKNPPLATSCFQQDGKVYYKEADAFGWDSRAMTDTAKDRSTWDGGWNPDIGWDGVAPLPLAAGDSITTPKSATAVDMPAAYSSLEAVAVLTVVDQTPPKDAFRPGPIRTAADRASYQFVTLSDIRSDLDNHLIADPLAGPVVPALNGNTSYGDLKNSLYGFAHLQQLLPGPGIRNCGKEPSEGVSPWYNDSEPLNVWGKPAKISGYGGTMGMRFGMLSIGSLASWLTPEQRLHCQTRLIQRAIDVYDAIKAGLTFHEDCGIQPGNSTLITVAGALLSDNCPKKAELLSVNESVNGIRPWVYFADYAMMKHTFTAVNDDMVNGEALNARRVPMGVDVGDMVERPAYNMTDVTGIASAKADTFTMPSTYAWPRSSTRPFYDLINVKVRVTGGAGAGDTIYVITRAPHKTFTSGNRGGTMTVKPAWQNGSPDADSKLALSVTTLEDVNKWIFCARGRNRQTDANGELALVARKEVTLAPNNGSYLAIHLGATIDQLIALYALDAEGHYRSGLDHWAIEAGKKAGFGESIFDAPGYMAMLRAFEFRGALWRQEVLNKAGAKFIYNDKTTDHLAVPSPSAKMWYELP